MCFPDVICSVVALALLVLLVHFALLGGLDGFMEWGKHCALPLGVCSVVLLGRRC